MSRLALAIVALALSLPAPAFDHSHPAWHALLAKHVRYLPGGNASQVAYAGFMEVSRIFDWYGKDFDKGHKGYASVKAKLAKYAFLDYDRGLNDTH